MEEKGKILIIDDNEDVLFALNLLLEPYMEQIRVTTQPTRIEHFMTTFHPDVILLDMNFQRDAISGQEGFDYLKQILRIDPQAVVVFMTAYADTGKAVQAIKAGATDFISKPWEKEKLLATLSAAVKLSRSRQEVGRLQNEVQALKGDDRIPELIGNSPAMQKVKETIYKLSDTDANLLILGENGTGKDLAARMLRFFSPAGDRSLFPSTWEVFRSSCSKVSSSGTKKVLSRMPEKPSREEWKRLQGVRCFWMKSVTCPCPCRPSC